MVEGPLHVRTQAGQERHLIIMIIRVGPEDRKPEALPARHIH